MTLLTWGCRSNLFRDGDGTQPDSALAAVPAPTIPRAEPTARERQWSMHLATRILVRPENRPATLTIELPPRRAPTDYFSSYPSLQLGSSAGSSSTVTSPLPQYESTLSSVSSPPSSVAGSHARNHSRGSAQTFGSKDGDETRIQAVNFDDGRDTPVPRMKKLDDLHYEDIAARHYAQLNRYGHNSSATIALTSSSLQSSVTSKFQADADQELCYERQRKEARLFKTREAQVARLSRARSFGSLRTIFSQPEAADELSLTIKWEVDRRILSSDFQQGVPVSEHLLLSSRGDEQVNECEKIDDWGVRARGMKICQDQDPSRGRQGVERLGSRHAWLDY